MFDYGMTVALPAFKVNAWLGLNHQPAVVNSMWGLCLGLVLFNTFLCLIIGTLIGFLLSVFKTKSLKPVFSPLV